MRYTDIVSQYVQTNKFGKPLAKEIKRWRIIYKKGNDSWSIYRINKCLERFDDYEFAIDDMEKKLGIHLGKEIPTGKYKLVRRYESVRKIVYEIHPLEDLS